MDKTELRDKTTALLALIWLGVAADYKSRYRMTIWAQFENEIKAAAYTNSLPKFLNSLCGRLNADLGRDASDRREADDLLAMLPDRETLKLLREETTYLCLRVRVANQERREAWEAAHGGEYTLPLESEEGET